MAVKTVTDIIDQEKIDRMLFVEYSVKNSGEGISRRAIAAEIGVPETTVRRHLKRLEELRKLYPNDHKLVNRNILSGSIEPKEATNKGLPKKGKIKRYIITSAQNNTKVFEPFFNNLVAYADYIDAELIVGTFTYSHNNNSEFTVKRGSNKTQNSLWWDSAISDYIDDTRQQLAPDLIWCGDWNILPTAVDPVASLDSYNGSKSNIFPATKLRQKSLGVQKYTRVKRNITTGTVTKLNYVARKAGMKAEFDHVFGAILVEVDSDGFWLHRQLVASSTDGSFYDMGLYISEEGIVEHEGVAAIVHGDIHAAKFDEELFPVIWDNADSVVKVLKPRTEVLHDLLDFESQNHHDRDIFKKFEKYVDGIDDVENELAMTAELLRRISGNSSDVLIPYSNHDDALERWLSDWSVDFRRDMPNAIIYLTLMKRKLEAIRDEEEGFSIWEWAIRNSVGSNNELTNNVDFLTDVDDSVIIEGIEVAKHGHIGTSGSRGSMSQYARTGQKIIVGHYHKAEIDRGAYSVGVYSKFYPAYAKGYNTWTHTFAVLHSNGKRQLVDIMKNSEGKYVYRH